ncbi:MAG: hypothetical protein ACK5NB_02375 [Flavobacteriaceae bacterium]
MEINKIIAQRIDRYNATQHEIVTYLLKNGFTEKEIKPEIEKFFPEIKKSDITDSVSFKLQVILLTFVSLLPLIGCFFGYYLQALLTSIVLLFFAYGFYKLKGFCILFWIVILAFLFVYILAAFVTKLSGKFVNSLFSYSLMTASLLLLLAMIIIACLTFSKHKAYKKQYKF